MMFTVVCLPAKLDRWPARGSDRPRDPRRVAPFVHPPTKAAIMGTRASLADGQLMPQAESYQTRVRLRRLLE
jgi:hypothetical protein